MVRRESEFKSKDLGFDPLAGQGEEQVFFCPSESTCADVFVPDPASCVQHAPKFVCPLKILYSSVVKFILQKE